MELKPIDTRKDNVLGLHTVALKKKDKKPVVIQPVESKSLPLNWASALVALSDGVVLLGAGIFIYWLYVGVGFPIFGGYALAMILVTATMMVAFTQTNLYSVSNICNPKSNVYKILGILAVTFMVFLAIGFAFKISEQFSRVWCFSWFLLSALLICLERFFCSLLIWRWAQAGRFTQKIVIVGSGEQAKRFLKQLKSKKEPWVSMVGVFDDRKARIGSSFMGFPVLGTLDDLLDFSRNNRVDDIIVTLPWSADKRLLQIIKRLEELPVTVSLCSDLAGFLSLRTRYSSMGGIPMLDVVNKPLDGWRYFIKVAEDKLLGLIFLVLFSPVVLLCALAIKLESKGPVLFRQKRYGFNNNEFLIYKFRSMYHGRPPENGVPQATKGDPRVTRVGAYLRKTSLDELPQLLNVLNGTMSIIGPRPHAVAHNEEYSKIINGYFSRHRVKPGMTGWAQVNGLRGETDTSDKMQARVEHDVHYIENWSLWLDAKILVKTAFVLSSQENAY